MNPYRNCPSFATAHFLLRLVREEDAEDILICYSDPLAQKFFNSDNCTSDFNYFDLADMTDCIRFWLKEYECSGFVRWSIIDRETRRAVDTIEMFGSEDKVGVCRIDLAAAYETRPLIGEFLELAAKQFFDLFGVNAMLSKAIPEAVDRTAALKDRGFEPINKSGSRGFDHYYILQKKS